MTTPKAVLHNTRIDLLPYFKNITSNSSSSWNSSLSQLDDTSSTNTCIAEKEVWHSSFFGLTLVLPEWEAILTVILLSIIIVLTIVGNILVILSVFTYKPLRIVQNFFIVSLAIADLTVALLVLPFNVAYSVLGRWEFGINLCKLWLTFDVMCCTSSILNLCIIALDRYWAITDPINYAHKRTVSRVLFLISGVWIASFIISSPPLLGWNDWPKEFLSTTPCELTSNRGYVIYSSLGSFFIPLIIMTIVYVEIYIAARRRLRERRLTSKLYNTSVKTHDLEISDENTAAGEKVKSAPMYSSLICCSKKFSRYENPLSQNDNLSVDSENRAKSSLMQTSLPRSSKRTQCLSIENSFENVNETHKCVSRTQRSLPDDSQTGRLVPESEDLCQNEETETNLTVNLQDSPDNKDMPNKISFSQLPIEACDLTVALEKKSTGVYQFIEEKQKISLSKERRAARTLGIIMGVFVICWLPFFLMYVILPFCDTCCPTQKLKNFITWLGYINSSLNPVIYTIFNLDFRKAFKRLLGLK